MEIAMTIPAKAKTGAGKTAAKAARYEGLVPAVIYGGDAEPEMVSIDPRPISQRVRQTMPLNPLRNTQLSPQSPANRQPSPALVKKT